MAVLVVVQLWLRLGAPPELRAVTNAQTVAAPAYVSNWYAIAASVGYWGALTDGTPLTHLWSLAVEEQFYLVWPLVLIIVLATRSRRLLGIVAAAGALASYCTAAALFGVDGPDRAYLGTDGRSGALLLGVLCALALTRSAPGPHGSWDRRLPARRRDGCSLSPSPPSPASGHSPPCPPHGCTKAAWPSQVCPPQSSSDTSPRTPLHSVIADRVCQARLPVTARSRDQHEPV